MKGCTELFWGRDVQRGTQKREGAEELIFSGTAAAGEARAVASLTVPGGQEFHFPHFFLKFRLICLIFPQTLLIFFLILAHRVGRPPGKALVTPLGEA